MGPRGRPGEEETAVELPYMTLFTQRFCGSRRVQALRDGDEWWYLGLLLNEWGFQGKGLPSDIGTLARLLRLPVETFREAWDGDSAGDRPGIAQFFELREGRLFNDTLETLYVESMSRKQALVRAAKKGNRKRWGKSARSSPGDRSAIARADGDGDGDVFNPDGGKGANGAKSKPRQARTADGEVLEFFFTDLCASREIAQEAVRRLGTTPADVEDWRAALKRLRAKGGLRDVRTYVRSRAIRFKNPKDADFEREDKDYISDMLDRLEKEREQEALPANADRGRSDATSTVRPLTPKKKNRERESNVDGFRKGEA
jgi:CRP-like cAMP-binding protein